MYVYFDRFELDIPLNHVMACTVPGQDASLAVSEALKESDIDDQLNAISPDDIRAELAEYGAWDEFELADDQANRERLVWCAAGHARDNLLQSITMIDDLTHRDTRLLWDAITAR